MFGMRCKFVISGTELGDIGRSVLQVNGTPSELRFRDKRRGVNHSFTLLLAGQRHVAWLPYRGMHPSA